MSTCGRKRSSVHSVIPRNDTGPRPPRGARACGSEGRDQRQRMDITRPATIAPKPIAKFQAPSVTMNGMRSPAT